MSTKRKEVPVKNNPGIYKKLEFDAKSNKWKDTGKYRALRRVYENGCSRKEQAVFNNIEEAKGFRLGRSDKSQSKGDTLHRHSLERDSENFYTFRTLIDEWKAFYYLSLSNQTKETYEKALPWLDFLKPFPVDQIDISRVDELIKYWIKDCPRNKSRQTFDKELGLLRTILNFYKDRKSPSYINPVRDDHYAAADIAKKAKAPVMALSQNELGLFLEDLKKQKNPLYYPLALAQFCLGLRIGEGCGLYWDSIDLENRIVRIERVVEWDYWTWKPRVKERPKNGKMRVLVIPEVLLLELKKLHVNRDPSVPFVFHKNGIPLNRKSVGTAYNRSLRALGFTHVSGTHMLRKTSATQANEVTGDFYAVSKLLDHSSPSVTLRYVAQTNSQKVKIANALDGVVKRALGMENLEANSMSSKVVYIAGNRAPVPQCPPQEELSIFSSVKSSG